MSEAEFSITEFNRYLKAALLLSDGGTFLYNVVVNFVHKSFFQYQYNSAYGRFLDYAHQAIDLQKYRRLPDISFWSIDLFVARPEEQKLATQLPTFLHQMEPEQAIKFLGELSAAYVLSSIMKQRLDTSSQEIDISIIEFAHTELSWLFRPLIDPSFWN
jgi:hypothetical protein